MNYASASLKKVLFAFLAMSMVCTPSLLALQEQAMPQSATPPQMPSAAPVAKKEPRRTWKKFIGFGCASFLSSTFIPVPMVLGTDINLNFRLSMPARVAFALLATTASSLTVKFACKSWRNFPDKEARRAAYHFLGAVDHGSSSALWLAPIIIPPLSASFSSIPSRMLIIPGLIWSCFVPLLAHKTAENWEKAKAEWTKYKTPQGESQITSSKNILAAQKQTNRSSANEG